MARIETLVRVAAITATLHDGTSMIVLTQDKPVRFAKSSLGFLENRNALHPEGYRAQLDHDGDGLAGGSEPDEPVSLTGRNKAQLLAIAGDEGVTVEDGATNKEIIAAIEAKRSAPPAIEPVEGHAASVLVSVEDGKFVVNAPWLDEPESYDDYEQAEARQTELREAGPPEGWEPAEGGEEAAPAS